MYYINSVIFYSILGFILESTIYKIHKSKRYSGILYGPATYVYGFGVLNLTLLKKYFLDRLKVKGILKLLITFVTSWIVLTFLEWLGGNILYCVFEVDMWNYSNKAFHCGKYICLELSLIWGVLGTFYVYYMKDFFDKFLTLIPKKLTYVLLILEIIDVCLVIIYKVPKW